MIPRSELRAMQAEQVRALQSTANLESEAFTDDGRGGQIKSFVPGLVGVPCRFATPTQRERSQVSDRFRNETVYVVTFPTGTPVESGDRVVTDAGTFEVLSVNEAETYDTAVRCFLRRVTE